MLKEEDPRNPPKKTKQSTCIWNDSMNKSMDTFHVSDEKVVEEYHEEKDNGEIKIDLQFRMDPMLDKRLLDVMQTGCSEAHSQSTFKVTGQTTTMGTLLAVKTIVKN
jgi:hypothetical protein